MNQRGESIFQGGSPSSPSKSCSTKGTGRISATHRVAWHTASPDFKLRPDLGQRLSKSSSPVRAIRKKRSKRSNNTVRVVMTTGAREGASYCTSSWADGSPGPLFISVGSIGFDALNCYIAKQKSLAHIVVRNIGLVNFRGNIPSVFIP